MWAITLRSRSCEYHCIYAVARGSRWLPRLTTVVLVVLVVLAACLAARSQARVAPTPDSSASEANLIHLGDVIDIDVEGNLEFDWRGPLTPEGFLAGPDTIPTPIYALCRTEGDIAAEVAAQYAKILRDPKIRVRILDRSRRAEAILDGAVRTPFRFQIRRRVRLNELLALSGGITDRSNGQINIFRPQSLNCRSAAKGAEGKEKIINASEENGAATLIIQIADLLSGNPQANPEILSGDIVTVAEAQPIYVIGGVNNPRQVSSKALVTLSRAIATCGGLSKDAEAQRITIFRRSGRSTETINADLTKIKQDKTKDIVLRPFDIVDVGQKGKDKRKFPPQIDDEAAGRNKAAGMQLRILD